MTREEKLNFIIQAIWDREGAIVTSSWFNDYSDLALDKEIEWIDHLLKKQLNNKK
jgi:hypothetical protein